MWAKSHNRSMSMDAVNTGTTGLVRSQAYNLSQKNSSVNADSKYQKRISKIFFTKSIINILLFSSFTCQLFFFQQAPLANQRNKRGYLWWLNTSPPNHPSNRKTQRPVFEYRKCIHRQHRNVVVRGVARAIARLSSTLNNGNNTGWMEQMALKS